MRPDTKTALVELAFDKSLKLEDVLPKKIYPTNCNPPASWPSSIFDLLDRIDENAAQVLALLNGGVR